MNFKNAIKNDNLLSECLAHYSNRNVKYLCVEGKLRKALSKVDEKKHFGVKKSLKKWLFTFGYTEVRVF